MKTRFEVLVPELGIGRWIEVAVNCSDQADIDAVRRLLGAGAAFQMHQSYIDGPIAQAIARGEVIYNDGLGDVLVRQIERT